MKLGDLKHLLALAAILSLGLGLFLIFNYSREIQIRIVLSLAFAYIIWGTVYHWVKKELYLRIILEYVLVATIAGMVAVFLLLRT